MDSNLKLLLYIFLGILIFWIGSTLYFQLFSKKRRRAKEASGTVSDYAEEAQSAVSAGSSAGSKKVSGTSDDAKKYKGQDNSGGLMICPVCLFQLESGSMIKATAFPPATPYHKDRLMHINGCVYCMGGKRERVCPVCGNTIGLNDFLVARLFDRQNRNPHVHVLGCTLCRPLKTM